jgi:hypothetical protein
MEGVRELSTTASGPKRRGWVWDVGGSEWQPAGRVRGAAGPDGTGSRGDDSRVAAEA